jgi:hypothetical protein
MSHHPTHRARALVPIPCVLRCQHRREMASASASHNGGIFVILRIAAHGEAGNFLRLQVRLETVKILQD